MQHPDSEKRVAREIAIAQCVHSELEKTIEVASAGASIDDNGAEHLHDISLKENATRDCADVSDTSLLALAKPIVDALHALFMYIGPYEGDAVSLSHLPEATQEELISRLIIHFHSTGGRPLADPDATVQKVIQETLKRKQTRMPHAGPSGDASHRYFRDGLLPPPSSSSSGAAHTLAGRPDFAKYMDWASGWMYKYITGRIGIGSALEGGEGTKTCKPDSDEDFTASRVSTRECFSGQVGDLDGVGPDFKLLP